MTTMAGQVDVQDVRALLQGLYLELSAEHDEATAGVAETADRAGDDEVDAGAKTAQREHQLTLAASILQRRGQVEHALERLNEGRYGTCERCSRPIAAERLDAFPAATSCVSCKPTPGRGRP